MCESDLLDESKASLGNKMDDNLDDKNREQSDNDNDNDTVILNDKTLTVIYCKYIQIDGQEGENKYVVQHKSAKSCYC